jgi:hypothetical protein
MKRRLQASTSNTSPPKKQAQSITRREGNLLLSGLVEMARLGVGSEFEAQILALLLHPGSRGLCQRYFEQLAHADLSLLARCEVCGEPFIKARKDKKCCKPKCANVFRVRKWRARYPEKYKQSRYAAQETYRRNVKERAVGE